ncbi:MAG TPA: hypothetical protein DCS09_10720 [Porphyromonadaceae bacterium]|nr:hypothetical protein [Porphyromonadaceae bacterium]HBA99741.1 hypothetical protein [Porphyromonadaceae bacterium]HCC17427.1 hypothetical protein [Porphyromonadaceae bacterium]
MHLVCSLSIRVSSFIFTAVSSASLLKVEVTGGLFIVLVIFFLTLLPKGALIFYASRKSRKEHQEEDKKTITRYDAEPVIDHYFEEIRELAIHNDPLFLKRFTEVYSDFTRRILQKHPGLLTSELSLCAMIFLNFSSKEIAEYTFIQHRSVQTNKSRLRKKLQLKPSTDLYMYIRSFV